MVGEYILKYLLASFVWVWLSAHVFDSIRHPLYRILFITSQGLGFLLGLTSVLLYGMMRR